MKSYLVTLPIRLLLYAIAEVIRRPAVYAAILLVAASVCRADSPPPVKPIRFPNLPVPAPPPPPNPTAPVALSTDQMYVVDSDVDVMAWAFPTGLLNITKAAGPMTIRGNFVDGSGSPEIRTYKGKTILIVEAAGSGSASLLVVPAGATDASAATTKLIDANVAPRPPPVPPAPPAPPAPPPTSAKVAWAFVLEDVTQRTQATALILADPAFWDGLPLPKSPAGGWHIFDVTDPNLPSGLKQIAANALANKVAYPMLVLCDAAGKEIRTVALPPTQAAVKTEVTK